MRRLALAMGLGAIALVSAAPTALGSFSPAGGWGGAGGGAGRFWAPAGLAIGPTGDVYVSDADPRSHRIQSFSEQGAFVGLLGDPALLGEPHGLATDAAGSVYVADAANARVVKLAPDGALLTTWGSDGDDEGQFVRPVAVAVDSAQRISVLDASGRVQQFTTDGAFIARWPAPPGTVAPADLAVAPDGDVLTLDASTGVVTAFDPDGVIAGSFGSRGSGEGQSQEAGGLTTDALGDVFIADRGNDRVEELSPQGAFIASIGTGGQLSGPVDVAVAADGALLVLDGGDQRVVRFEEPVGGGSAGDAGGGVTVTAVSGRVLVRAAKSRRFVPVKGILLVAAGSLVDARHGGVTLQAGTGAGAAKVRLRAGIVTVRLRRARHVDVALSGGGFASCARSPRVARVVRRLAVVASGAATIRGRDSTTTSSGGAFEVRDACRGTTTLVRQGRVTVTPRRGGRVRVLSAGHAALVPHRYTS